MASFDPKIRLLIHSIENAEVDIPDQEVIDEFYQFNPSYECWTAAEGYLAVASSILYFRPSLEEVLLKKVLEPLYFLGIEDPSVIMLWADDYIKRENKYLTPTIYGMKWLKNFDQKKDVVVKLFHKVCEEYEDEL